MSDLFDVLRVPPVDPSVVPPIAGRTIPSRHASSTGAAKVVKTWSTRQSAVLQLLAGGAMSRQELAAVSHLPINSVCSVVGNLLERGVIEPDPGNWDIAQWPDGTTTTRERFRVKR